MTEWHQIFLPAHYLVLRHPVTLLTEFPGIDVSVSLELSSYCKHHGREQWSDHTVTFIYRCQHYEYHTVNSCASQWVELTWQTNMKWLKHINIRGNYAFLSTVLPPLLQSGKCSCGLNMVRDSGFSLKLMLLKYLTFF